MLDALIRGGGHCAGCTRREVAVRCARDGAVVRCAQDGVATQASGSAACVRWAGRGPCAARVRRCVMPPTNLVASNFLLVWVRSPAGERGPYLGRLSNDSRETTSAEALKTTYPGVVRHPGAPPIITGQPRSLFGLARGSDQHASIGAERSEPNNQHAPNIANETKHACNGPA